MMKIPLFSKLTAKPRGRKVVRASAARAARGHDDDYYEEEPNMKLSHAFMVVLILHVVAVGGIYAFNHINARKNTNLLANISDRIAQGVGAASAAPAAVTPAPAAGPEVVTTQPAAPATQVAATTAPAAPTVTADTKPAPPAAAAAPAKAPAVPAAPVEVPEVYTVERGDNPYTIAKRFGISYQDLLTLNGIEDPTKLQIGQKLKMPRPGQ